MYKWARRVKRGEPYYEVSSKGDKRYSALFAKLNGKSIEEIYQLDIKGYRGKVKNWLQAKKKLPLNKSIEQAYEDYKELWITYFKQNPNLLEDIKNKAKNKTITNMFGITPINQARAICEILNDTILVKNILNKENNNEINSNTINNN